MNGHEEEHQRSDITPPKHSAKLRDNASVFNFQGEGRVRRICQQPRLPQSLPGSQDSLFIFCSNTISFMSLFTIFKKKGQAMLCKSNIPEISFGGHSIFHRGPWRGRERDGSVPPAPPHMVPAATGPRGCCHSSHAPAQQPPASGRQQTVPGAKGDPPGKPWPAFTDNAAFSSLLSQ